MCSVTYECGLFALRLQSLRVPVCLRATLSGMHCESRVLSPRS